jgi:hypothetical protein
LAIATNPPDSPPYGEGSSLPRRWSSLAGWLLGVLLAVSLLGSTGCCLHPGSLHRDDATAVITPELATVPDFGSAAASPRDLRELPAHAAATGDTDSVAEGPTEDEDRDWAAIVSVRAPPHADRTASGMSLAMVRPWRIWRQGHLSRAPPTAD